MSLFQNLHSVPSNKIFSAVLKHSVSQRTMSGAPDLNNCKLVTPLEEAKRFMVDCFKAAGTKEDNALIVAENLVTADYRGHYSHGMNRLEMYIRDIQSGFCNPNAECVVEREGAATAVVNCGDGLGAVTGKYCMDLAIKKAKEVGIGLVVARGANHYGIAGMYSFQAIQEGCIGMSVTNTSPFMVPTRSKGSALGTNPISLGAPALNGDSFLLDMATTAVAVGKVELSRRKGIKIPEGWALNEYGQAETDPEIVMNSGKLMPLGGNEQHSGYKGYGLGMFVEIFSSMLSGAKFGPNIRKWTDKTGVADLGQGFMAIDPKFFADGFEDRLSNLMDGIRQMAPVDPDNPVLIHGDPERIHMKKVDKNGGLLYVKNQHNTNELLSQELGVNNMVSACKKI